MSLFRMANSSGVPTWGTHITCNATVKDRELGNGPLIWSCGVFSYWLISVE